MVPVASRQSTRRIQMVGPKDNVSVALVIKAQTAAYQILAVTAQAPSAMGMDTAALPPKEMVVDIASVKLDLGANFVDISNNINAQ